MTDAPALEVSGLTVAYRRRGLLTEAIKDVDIQLEPGGRMGLVGESGSGKTTVAHAILRYLPRNARVLAGTIKVAGTDILKLPERELAGIRGRQIAAVSQDPGTALNPTMTIGRQLDEVFERHFSADRAEARNAAVDALGRVHLPSPEQVADSYPHQLSGGQQQRVMIAIALSANPSLLLLDEPTTGLDATVEAAVVELIEDLARDSGTAILMVSHNLPLVSHICQRSVVMRAGEVVESGPTVGLLTTPEHPYTRALVDSVPSRKHHKLTNPVRGGDAAVEVGASEGPSITSTDVVMSLRRLVKNYDTRHGVVHAVRGVDLEMRRGEILAIVGESGSGKSTLARCVVGLESYDDGELVIEGAAVSKNHRGRDRSRSSRRPTLIFQNPESSLNPKKSARSVLRQALRLAGQSPDLVDDIATATQLTPEHLEARTRGLSGGQKQRVAIARASVGDPAIVVCDEPVSALDVSVQAGILNLLAQRQRTTDVSYLFISHDLDVVHYIADSIAVMYMGEIVERGSATAVFSGPQHPYTAALMSASLTLDPADKVDRLKLTGPTPSAYAPVEGCVFASRCPVVLDGDACRTTAPPWRDGPGGKRFRCHRSADELLHLLPIPTATPANAAAAHDSAVS